MNDIENMFYNVDVEDLCIDFVVLGNEYEEEIDREEGLIFLNRWGCFDFGKYVLDYDIGFEFGI